eukprot:SAG22_NODE_7550_length_729_cov_1.230159_1_plen_131_part_01
MRHPVGAAAALAGVLSLSACGLAAAESPLAAALTRAREDVLQHVAEVEGNLALMHPPPGSIGAYLLGGGVYRKAATFSLFNTTFLNEDITNATDTEAELVFQQTGVTAPGELGGLDADMWLRDSGAQAHYF